MRGIRMLRIGRAKGELPATVAMPIPGYKRLAWLLAFSNLRVRKVSLSTAVTNGHPSLVYQC